MSVLGVYDLYREAGITEYSRERGDELTRVRDSPERERAEIPGLWLYSLIGFSIGQNNDR